MRSAAFPVIAMSVVLGGCVQGGSPNNTLVGGGIGALGGAAIGALVARGNPALGALVGAAGGGAVGALIGRQLDQDSERRRQEAMQRAASAPMQAAQWAGSDAGTGGRVQFLAPPARARNGQTCATVQETISVGGQAQQADRRTCRRPDGTWT